MTADLPPVPEESITAGALVLADVEGDDQTYRDLASDVLRAAAPAIRAAERERVAAEIEAEAAGHLFSVRRAMRWAVWVVRGKPEDDSPSRDMLALRKPPGWLCCPVETAARADERKAIAASLRSLPVLGFLHRHGLEPGASGRPLLCAAAAEIEGPGAPGCEQHPGPQEARDG